MSQPYVYVFVRTDIPLADQVCQTAHACLEAGRKFGVDATTFLVLLAVENKQQLLAVAETMARNKVDHVMVTEPDDDMGETAIASGHVLGSTRRLFRGHRLWRHA